MANAKKTARKPMSDEHKAALAEGRAESRAVRRYLEALEAIKPKRGRPRTADSVKKQLDLVEQKLADARAEERLLLIQQRLDLQAELASMEAREDLADLEAEFVAVAKRYGERKGITYAAWREAGVDAAVLRKAGISRSS